ncbi:SMP-30/Gluconolaconase/LRE-like region-containing protein [Mycolicibacterium rutilum]|uniref:SMP-30/Gluconolaconase/LRE-like region-containing protein n=1 Tax=Mycolicibacterium rutilum TaxID=370526 RepID=A0A1H6LZB6_MYCRU|nr:SMP-30/gluconolactonase/LRE family protein [Mycolicibacterium rutilum]SEH91891.1 SMP-30/Gluconolaconase/LRE-like region-containing protein [Mycolicibacterium rutilum]
MSATDSKKPPIDPVRWQPPPVDPLPDLPSAELTIVPLPGDAPEDVVVDGAGHLWTGLVDGRILRVSPEGDARVVATVEGRPLGMHVAHDGRILVCASPGGLFALDPDSGALETLVAEVDDRRLMFCSNVTQSADGTIYFTESTSAFSYAHFKGAAFEARPRGSLFRRDADGSVLTVVAGLYFANGVTPTADGSALVFAETLGRRLSKYWLTGERAGSVTRLAEHLPCMPDNLSTGADGRIWCAMVSGPSAAAEWLAPRSPALRKLLWKLPDRFQPQLAPEVWAVAFDPDSGEVVAGIRTEHPQFGLVTGLVESGGRLWMGTIGFPALAHCPIP